MERIKELLTKQKNSVIDSNNDLLEVVNDIAAFRNVIDNIKADNYSNESIKKNYEELAKFLTKYEWFDFNDPEWIAGLRTGKELLQYMKTYVCNNSEDNPILTATRDDISRWLYSVCQMAYELFAEYEFEADYLDVIVSSSRIDAILTIIENGWTFNENDIMFVLDAVDRSELSMSEKIKLKSEFVIECKKIKERNILSSSNSGNIPVTSEEAEEELPDDITALITPSPVENIQEQEEIMDSNIRITRDLRESLLASIIDKITSDVVSNNNQFDDLIRKVNNLSDYFEVYSPNDYNMISIEMLRKINHILENENSIEEMIGFIDSIINSDKKFDEKVEDVNVLYTLTKEILLYIRSNHNEGKIKPDYFKMFEAVYAKIKLFYDNKKAFEKKKLKISELVKYDNAVNILVNLNHINFFESAFESLSDFVDKYKPLYTLVAVDGKELTDEQKDEYDSFNNDKLSIEGKIKKTNLEPFKSFVLNISYMKLDPPTDYEEYARCTIARRKSRMLEECPYFGIYEEWLKKKKDFDNNYKKLSSALEKFSLESLINNPDVFLKSYKDICTLSNKCKNIAQDMDVIGQKYNETVSRANAGDATLTNVNNYTNFVTFLNEGFDKDLLKDNNTAPNLVSCLKKLMQTFSTLPIGTALSTYYLKIIQTNGFVNLTHLKEMGINTFYGSQGNFRVSVYLLNLDTAFNDSKITEYLQGKFGTNQLIVGFNSSNGEQHESNNANHITKSEDTAYLVTNILEIISKINNCHGTFEEKKSIADELLSVLLDPKNIRTDNYEDFDVDKIKKIIKENKKGNR